MKYLLLTLALLTVSCKAQTSQPISIADYPNFYNNVVPKLNSIVPNKTQFYGQPFSNFYTELLNKNINITTIGIHSKEATSPKNYILHLNLSDDNIWRIASDNQFQYPSIWITFENEIPNQALDILKQNQGEWNTTFAQFFSNMKIEKIKFSNINGYDNPDRTSK